jgi:hypothetical protein
MDGTTRRPQRKGAAGRKERGKKMVVVLQVTVQVARVHHFLVQIGGIRSDKRANPVL